MSAKLPVENNRQFFFEYLTYLNSKKIIYLHIEY